MSNPIYGKIKLMATKPPTSYVLDMSLNANHILPRIWLKNVWAVFKTPCRTCAPLYWLVQNWIPLVDSHIFPIIYHCTGRYTVIPIHLPYNIIWLYSKQPSMPTIINHHSPTVTINQGTKGRSRQPRPFAWPASKTKIWGWEEKERETHGETHDAMGNLLFYSTISLNWDHP